MPLIDAFNGIKIYVYYDDHPPPHIHAKYNEFEMQIIIKSGNPLAGDLPVRQKKTVHNWLLKRSSFVLKMFYLYNPKLK